jgi:hypothetical protein
VSRPSTGTDLAEKRSAARKTTSPRAATMI